MISNINDFKEIINKIDRIHIEENNDELVIEYNRGIGKKFTIDKASINEIINNLKKKRIAEETETVLYNEYSYETLIKIESPLPYYLKLHGLPDTGISIKDDANNIEYNLHKPSNEYILFILERILNNPDYKSVLSFIPHFEKEKIKNKKYEDFFEFLSDALLRRIYTLKIISNNKPMNSTKFSDLTTAFLFNLSYNLDVPMIEVRFLDELGQYRLRRLKRLNIDEMEPPRRTYINDLIYRYQMAISTDSPQLQFLSFYHIIEHFFLIYIMKIC